MLAHISRVFAAIFVFALFFASPLMAAGMDENIQAGTAAYKAGDFKKAAQLLSLAGEEMAMAKNPQAPLLLGNAAIAWLKAEDYAKAAEIFEDVIANYKKLPEDKLRQYYYNLVLCRAEMNQRAMQLATIDKMFKALPKMPAMDACAVYFHQGDAYRMLELYRPAVEAYEKALKILPKNAAPAQRAMILTALGLCQGNLGDYGRAQKNLEEARKIAETIGRDKTLVEANSNLGLLSWERGDYPQARKLIQSALDLAKEKRLRQNEGSDHNSLGMVHLGTGNYEEAMRNFERSIAIARELGNVRSEGIAMENRALLNRIAGRHMEALADYGEAEKLFAKAGFQEGQASSMLGLGRMAELVDKDYVKALENYGKALEIFEDLELPRWRAAALLLLGDAHKRVAAPGRASRDLVFDDEPKNPEMGKDEALAKAGEYYQKSVDLAESLHSREILWGALQGLGFVDFQEGRLEAALENYRKAIGIVAAMFVSPEDVKLFGEYMAGKEDLYNEAMEVCDALYKKTGDKKYLDEMLRYSETMRNEIQKASAALANLKFENPKKQKLFEALKQKGLEAAKAARAVPVEQKLGAESKPEEKRARELRNREVSAQKAAVQKLEDDYGKLLAEWKKQYPEDANIFDSAARVDLADVQKHLEPGQAALHYTQLPDSLVINVIKPDGIVSKSLDVKRKDLENIIKKDFLVECVEKGVFRDKRLDPYKKAYERDPLKRKELEKEHFDRAVKVLGGLYKLLIDPVKADLADAKRLYIISDGYLAQTPFAALVAGINEDGPKYLVEDYEIAYIRPSFIEAIRAKKDAGNIKKLFAVANPHNDNFQMDDLVGTIREVDSANSLINAEKNKKDIALENSADLEKGEAEELLKNSARPTEKWVRDKLNNKYEMVYFATHGMPYSNVMSTLNPVISSLNKGKKVAPKWEKMLKLKDANLKTPSPLNGFLLLSAEENDDILKGDIPENRDGLLTLKEIKEMDKAFEGTKYVILSACNTGVSFVPMALKDGLEDIFDNKETERELRKQGWVPGVDQVGFVDEFMRKGIRNVYGTLWFAEDESSGKLMGDFIADLQSGENTDAVAAFANAQRKFIEASKAYVKDPQSKKAPISTGCYPHNPFYWSVGSIFGK